VEPKDGIESMLALQMAGLHFAILRMMSLLANSDEIMELEITERAVGRLQA
jgi:hypothetical protein